MGRISATVDDATIEEISILAFEDKRSFSEMVSLLLQLAVKEKTRKRSGPKKNNTEHNATDKRSSDAG